MILGLDHVIVAAPDLEEAMAAYRRLGFEVLRGGEHPKFGTHNALVPLTDGFYIELVGIKDRKLAQGSPLTRLVVEALGRRERLARYALDSDDLKGDIEAIRTRRLSLGNPSQGERLRPDGVRVVWHTAHPDDPRLPFLIEDETPREVRVPRPTEGLGRMLRLAYVEIHTNDTDGLSRSLKKLLGVEPQEGRFLLKRGEIRVHPNSEGYRLTRLAFATDDPEAIASEWESRSLPLQRVAEDAEEALALPPEEAAGVALLVIAG